MGGSVGEVLDHNLNEISGGLGGSKKAFQIKSSAEDLQQSMMEQTGLTETTDAITDTVASTLNEKDDPFSRASLSNTIRRRNKTGFGRRQTFKGLTG